MELKYVGNNIYGQKRYEYPVNDNCIIYCTLMKSFNETVLECIVGLPGGKNDMTKQEAEKYRLGIECDVVALTKKHPNVISTNFYKKDAHFGDFYTEEGQLIKKMVIHEKKHHLFDGTGYYEVTSNTKCPSANSTETFVSKDEAHKFMLSPELISEKEKYEKIFLEIFEKLR